MRSGPNRGRNTHLGKPAVGRREVVRPELISLDDVVSGVENMLRRTIGEEIELDVRLAGQSTTIVAVRGRIEQVLVNSAVNARDAMADGGTLLIDSSVIDVDASFDGGFAGIKPGRFVRLRVGDTGHGMAPEVVQHAFDPFYTTKPKGEGTGTGPGLATVYGIVTQAAGSCRSTPRSTTARASRHCSQPPTAVPPRLPPRSPHSWCRGPEPCWWWRTRRQYATSPIASCAATAIRCWWPRMAPRRSSWYGGTGAESICC